MPPILALLLGIALSLWLIHQDRAERRATSAAIWIPAAWLLILGSRGIDEWFSLGAAPTGSNLEGSPMNLLVQATLMIGAFVILQRRGLSWGTLWRSNWPLLLLYAYLALSTLWSEYPFVAFRRLTKDFGCVLMVLVLLTERAPLAAVRIVFVRCAYILFPLSAVIGKYYPAIGREYSVSGEPSFMGLTTQKNTLGEVLLVFGLMLVWDLVTVWRAPPAPGRRRRIAIRLGVLGVGAWLQIQSDSATALICLTAGGLLLWSGKWLARVRRRRTLVAYALLAVLIGMGLQRLFAVQDSLLQALGRNATLTGRTEIWEAIGAQPHASWIGNGFYVFWDSSKGQAVFSELKADFVTAHNGYLEMFLDGGSVGVALLGVMLLAGGGRVMSRLMAGRFWGRIGLMFWIIALFYNYSESNFFRLGVLWFVLLLVTIETGPPREPAPLPRVTSLFPERVAKSA